MHVVSTRLARAVRPGHLSQARQISHEEIVQLMTAAAPIATVAIFATVIVTSSNSRFRDSMRASDQRFAERQTATDQLQKVLDRRFDDLIRAFSDNRAADKEIVNQKLLSMEKSIDSALATIQPSEESK